MDEQKIVYRKLKDDILGNQKGLVDRGYFFEATKERAFLDRLYLFPEYYFDNPEEWIGMYAKRLPIYKSRKLEKILDTYIQAYARTQ